MQLTAFLPDGVNDRDVARLATERGSASSRCRAATSAGHRTGLVLGFAPALRGRDPGPEADVHVVERDAARLRRRHDAEQQHRDGLRPDAAAELQLPRRALGDPARRADLEPHDEDVTAHGTIFIDGSVKMVNTAVLQYTATRRSTPPERS